MEINDDFIREWHPRYDEIEHDEGEYQRLVKVVSADLSSLKTLSKQTFLDIYRWKGALRIIGRVNLDAYDALYAPAFHRAAMRDSDDKLAVLIGPRDKLPGVGAPTGSTILHVMHPDVIPIMDVRTVNVLHALGLVSHKSRDLYRYPAFKAAIEDIRGRCPHWTLREIDRALFTYHKLVLGNDSQAACG